MDKRRVVVTGMGVVSPMGCTLDGFWRALQAGQSGIEHIDNMPESYKLDINVEQLRSKICGVVKDFPIDDYFDPKEAKKFDPFLLYGIACADMAIANANLSSDTLDGNRVGVAAGSGIGGLTYIEDNYAKSMQKGAKRISPFFIPGTIINMLPGMISIRNGFRGPNLSMVSACTTGTHNIGMAARMIAHGDVDVMLAGGSEKASVVLGLGGFASLRALSTRNDDPKLASRPFDQDRNGFVLADGAGMLVLELYEHAKQRGANILAELTGFGMSADALHMTQPDPNGTGATRAMQQAIDCAGLTASDIDYINAHGTSTRLNDAMEANAIVNLLGDSCDKTLVSSTKSMHGHMLGAAGAVEAIATIFALQHGVIPPTINCDNPDVNPKLNLVRNTACDHNIKAALSNSFGFGGTNATLLFESVK